MTDVQSNQGQGQPPQPANAPARTLRAWPTLDQLTKMVGLLVAVIGIWKYFYDHAAARENAAQARAIGYVESYAKEPLLGARQQLYTFWSTQPDLVNVLAEHSLSERQYAAMLTASVFRSDGDIAIREPLLLLDSFYSQISFCRASGLCDAAITDAYFCRVSKRNAVAYAPFYTRLAAVTGDTSIGAELQSYASLCQLN
ncbi:hypothetical protein HOY34_16210 [Xinfangfangia sp. D13-10-4-6]|uniref:hypothetical protein n=1 Tax=Pseudogemmobacter hezensis TaxID=2737662 RepID=UPI0015545AFC|nr:hypothetical protein [Pseudogemmobacter hezensis]NPD16736.1 hypothetical protein [Pseudogemmobacter hezensis]